MTEESYEMRELGRDSGDRLGGKHPGKGWGRRVTIAMVLILLAGAGIIAWYAPVLMGDKTRPLVSETRNEQHYEYILPTKATRIVVRKDGEFLKEMKISSAGTDGIRFKVVKDGSFELTFASEEFGPQTFTPADPVDPSWWGTSYMHLRSLDDELFTFKCTKADAPGSPQYRLSFYAR
jgi:hypothetical protein